MLQNNQSPLISLSDTETTQRYEPCKNVPHKSGEENNFEDFWQKAQIKSLWRTRTVSENLGTCNICRLLVPLFFLLFCASSIDLLLRRNKLLNHIQANPWHYRKTKHLLMSEVFLMFKVCAFFFFLRDYQYNPRLIVCITVQLENRSVLFPVWNLLWNSLTLRSQSESKSYAPEQPAPKRLISYLNSIWFYFSTIAAY